MEERELQNVGKRIFAENEEKKDKVRTRARDEIVRSVDDEGVCSTKLFLLVLHQLKCFENVLKYLFL